MNINIRSNPMRKWFIWAIVLIGCLPINKALAQQSGDAERNTLRFMSYNIRNGRGMDEVTDLGRIAEAIRKVAPDVVAVQEVDSVTGRSGGIDVLRTLGERTLMFPTYAPAIDFDGGKYGVGMLSKEKPVSYRYIALPGREEERVLLWVEFERYIFCCTHLSLTPEDRMLSLPILRREAASAHKPLFIAGDWNATAHSPFITEISKDFQLLSNPKQATFPASTPDSCLDYIAGYVKNGQPFTRLSAWVPEEAVASDHRPVVTEVRLKARPEEIFYAVPYLQNPTEGGITVMWQTRVPTYSWVEYGTDTLNLKKARTIVDGQVICNGLHNKIRLTDLRPGQTYYYRVCSQEIMLYQAYKKEFGETAVSPFYTFKVPSASQKDFTALIFNDLHKHIPTLDALYGQVRDIPYDFVVFNGDCIDDPANEKEALYHLAYLCGKVGASHVPAFFLRGNHEIRNAYSIGLRALFDYVGDKTYGAFNWGDTRFVMLDCGEDKPDSTWVYYGLNDFTGLRKDQVNFLSKELSGKEFKQASKRVLLNHIPIYGNGDAYEPCPELWGSLLAKAPFNVNISAHTHQYAFHPKDSLGNNFPVIVGGGYKLDSATVMVLRKKGDEMSVRVLNAKGETLLDLKL